MFNKELKKAIALAAVLLFNSNLVFAEIKNITIAPTKDAPTTTTGSPIDIVKSVTATKTTTLGSINGQHTEGNSAAGSKGVTMATAYLTPDRQFGYAHIENYSLIDGSGTIVADRDDYGTSWGGGLNKGTEAWTNKKLYQNARDYFVNPANGPYKAISELKASEYNTTDHYRQTNDEGENFIASTFYIRYLYDIPGGSPRTNPYETSTPIFPTDDYKTGPYIGIGDYFDETIDVIAPGGMSKIRNNTGKYIASLYTTLKETRPVGTAAIIKDQLPDNSEKKDTVRAVLEKRFEYRRYLGSSITSTENKDSYEFVYPVTTTTVTKQAILPNISPSIAVDVTVNYNDTQTAIDSYKFDIDTVVKSAAHTYSAINQDYIVTKPSEEPTKEPRENQMDNWHTDTKVVLDIVDADGTSRLIDKKTLAPNKSSITIYPSDIKAKNGSKLLSGATATATLEFKNKVRYMSKREDYAYNYTLNNEAKSYSEVTKYISTKDVGLRLEKELKIYQDTTNPRKVLTYTTATSPLLSIAGSTGIFDIINGGDFANTTVGVEVDPPNTLTILEGADFDVKIDVNTNNIPINDSTYNTWISEFILNKITITSARGDIIYTESNRTVTPTDGNSRAKITIPNLTANPYHIGIAKVVVEYSYKLNQRTFHSRAYQEPDENGKLVTKYETSSTTDSKSQKGSSVNTFNIYSLSGATINK